MSLTPREFLVREVGERIADLLQDRERAVTLEQYQTHSRWILEELERIEPMTQAMIEARRKPWLRIIEQLISEIETSGDDIRARFGLIKGSQFLFINTHLTMATMSRSQWMRERWDELTVKSGAALKKELLTAGVVLLDANGIPVVFGKSIAVIVSKLAKHGLSDETKNAIQVLRPEI